MSAIKKKSESCEEKLRRMCKSIAEDIEKPVDDQAASFMEGTYDIRYYVDSSKRYLGAEIMCAGGGPTIWVNTYTKEVEGYWGGDRVEEPIYGAMVEELDNYCEKLYGC